MSKIREVPLGELADEYDELDWNVEEQGRMRTAIAPEAPEPETNLFVLED